MGRWGGEERREEERDERMEERILPTSVRKLVLRGKVVLEQSTTC